MFVKNRPILIQKTVYCQYYYTLIHLNYLYINTLTRHRLDISAET